MGNSLTEFLGMDIHRSWSSRVCLIRLRKIHRELELICKKLCEIEAMLKSLVLTNLNEHM